MDSNADPLASGTLETSVTGTSTALAIYADAALTTANPTTIGPITRRSGHDKEGDSDDDDDDNGYGYSRDEFLAMTLKDIRPPEDVERLLQWLQQHDLELKIYYRMTSEPLLPKQVRSQSTLLFEWSYANNQLFLLLLEVALQQIQSVKPLNPAFRFLQ